MTSYNPALALPFRYTATERAQLAVTGHDRMLQPYTRTNYGSQQKKVWVGALT